jgi:hypothetical protein
MSLPVPRPGLVIRYSYLWAREADQGQEEGVKDRPCAVVLVVFDEPDRPRVRVLPITHTAPADPRDGLEIPPANQDAPRARLGAILDRAHGIE